MKQKVVIIIISLLITIISIFIVLSIFINGKHNKEKEIINTNDNEIYSDLALELIESKNNTNTSGLVIMHPQDVLEYWDCVTYLPNVEADESMLPSALLGRVHDCNYSVSDVYGCYIILNNYLGFDIKDVVKSKRIFPKDYNFGAFNFLELDIEGMLYLVYFDNTYVYIKSL